LRQFSVPISTKVLLFLFQNFFDPSHLLISDRTIMSHLPIKVKDDDLVEFIEG
jgi:hypothetical protein